MSLLQNSNAISTGVTGYNLTDSVRFRADADGFLRRTPTTTSNRRTWTYSLWIKLAKDPTETCQLLYGSDQTTTTDDRNFQLRIQSDANGAWIVSRGYPNTNFFTGSSKLRDPSAWYHIVFAVDTTQATASNRMKLYINGVEDTQASGSISQNQDTAINWTGAVMAIGGITLSSPTGAGSFNGYMTEVNFVDGQQLAASDFGEYDDTTGVWKPKEYTGTYGNNGWYLDMSTSGSTVTDQSGNGNDWTANNMNLTTSTATTYDKMTDVPTLTDEDTGNFATLNPVNKPSSHTLSNGNLTTAITSIGGTDSTIGVSSGKWYCEVTLSTVGADTQLGVTNLTSGYVTAYLGQYTTSWGCITFNGNRIHNGSQSAYGSSFSNGDVGMIALDMDTGKWYCGKNGTWFNSGDPANGTNPAHTGLTGVMKFAIGSNSSSGNHSINFGQRPFAYTPPTGYKKLNTYNLPDSTILDGSQYMNPVLYTGNSGTQSITGVGFSPDLVWIKNRSNANNHGLWDTVRGYNRGLESNTTNAESYPTTNLSSFDADGFTLGSSSNQTNNSSYNYVAWNWRGSDSAAVSNTDGSITSTVSANTTSGFSVVTADNLSGTSPIYIGHGLGVAPSVVIGKIRDNTSNWYVQHTSLPTPSSSYLMLNSTNAYAVSSNIWDAVPSATTFRIGNPQNGWNGGSATAQDYVFYCFAEIEGFSKFGSYTGNGSTDGPFVYTGFRPAFIMLKNINSSTRNWNMLDSTINDFNVADNLFYPDSSNAELTSTHSDFLSNGFKIKNTGVQSNGSGDTMIYMAFAESPFKNSLAR